MVELLKYFDERNTYKPMIRFSFLSNYNNQLIVNELKKTLNKNKINYDLYLPGFNQYIQEIYAESSPLLEFKPDIIYVSIDLYNLCSDILDEIYPQNGSEIIPKVMKRLQQFLNQIKHLRSKLPKTKIFIDNFYLDTKIYSLTESFNSEFSITEIPFKINLMLVKYLTKTKQINIIDLTSLIQSFGEMALFDSRLVYLSKNKWSQTGIKMVAALYYSHFKAYRGIRKKCIVLDLDNTLWGGVVGQDGKENITLSNDGLGKSFYDFQKELLKLYKKGILLAICSKNNEKDAIDVIENHPYMILRKEFFISKKINWEAKDKNIREIADEINIGLDSMIFLDDSPFERGLVKKSIPELDVYDLPEDPSNYATFIARLDCFNFHSLTKDDLNRNENYKDNIERTKQVRGFSNIDDYYYYLKMEVEVKEVDDFSFPRLCQLIQKTNQFNLTTKRYLESELITFRNSAKYKLLVLSVKDIYGDNGLTGLALLKGEEGILYIDSFIMSCRIIGRTIETALLAYIQDYALKNNFRYLIGDYIPTEKNYPCSDMYKKHNFEKIDQFAWKLDLLEKRIDCPDWIKINGV